MYYNKLKTENLFEWIEIKERFLKESSVCFDDIQRLTFYSFCPGGVFTSYTLNHKAATLKPQRHEGSSSIKELTCALTKFRFLYCFCNRVKKAQVLKLSYLILFFMYKFINQIHVKGK
jgi:hypothetical protein